MLLVKKIAPICLCICLSLSTLSFTNINSKALVNEPIAVSTVDINKEGSHININIDTEQIGNTITNISNETKNGIEELNKKGFFKRLATWFEEFMQSLFSLFKDLSEMFKK